MTYEQTYRGTYAVANPRSSLPFPPDVPILLPIPGVERVDLSILKCRGLNIILQLLTQRNKVQLHRLVCEVTTREHVVAVLRLSRRCLLY